VAKFVTTDYSVTLDSTDFSNSIASVTLELTAETQETTAFGDTARTRVSGLQDGTLSIDFHQDFGASSIDATFFPLLGSAIPFSILPTSDAVGATNPSYSGTCIVTQYLPFDSSVGDLATLSVSWELSGPVTRATA